MGKQVVSILLVACLFDQNAFAEDVDQTAAFKAVFQNAIELEGLSQFDLAISKYEEALKILPDVAIAHFRIAICHGAQNREKLAIAAVRKAIRLQLPESHIPDARARLRTWLLPRLTQEQVELIELASDLVQVAAELKDNEAQEIATKATLGQAKPIDLGNPDAYVRKIPTRFHGPLKRAFATLEKIQGETTDYLPIHLLRGNGYELLGDMLHAEQEYEKYVKGFEALDYVPDDFRKIRRRMLACATEVKSAQEELPSVAKRRTELETQFATASKRLAELSKATQAAGKRKDFETAISLANQTTPLHTFMTQNRKELLVEVRPRHEELKEILGQSDVVAQITGAKTTVEQLEAAK